MLEIENPRTKLSKKVNIQSWSDEDINKAFKIYQKAGYKIQYKG